MNGPLVWTSGTNSQVDPYSSERGCGQISPNTPPSKFKFEFFPDNRTIITSADDDFELLEASKAVKLIYRETGLRGSVGPDSGPVDHSLDRS